ncbi:MAG: YjbF family lipoprotein [Enterobacterales bacterium endosymbiont of Blomia tropicalis]|uniref:YjbF family lipoprotein n=1 Tax=Mixta mediterraneensis TaxID=2758443 RepID=UPI0025A8C121|nr:YjbF family lipoprotein [Mixta mediterraneensis]MDL4915509.1 YjbF family lipoprotein [Mixta mediterraneensis]
MRQLPLLLACLLLQACTQTQKGLEQTVMLAISGPDDVTITSQQINDLPYASLYARINDGPRIFVVLGYNENDQQKWVTQDKAMLVTAQGRLIKTLGLPNNLQQVSNLQHDPLADGLHIRKGASWTRIVQWTEQGKVRAATVSSLFQRGEDQVLDVAGHRIACRVWHEQARIDSSGREWENTFWIDSRSGEVVQARQMLAADAFPVETTILKPAKS